MTSLEEIKTQEKELKKQKLILQYQGYFDQWKERTETDSEAIIKFLMGKDGVHWDPILFFIETKEDIYPSVVADLRLLLELYKSEQLILISLEKANEYVSRLKPLGFHINVERHTDATCDFCGKEERFYSLHLLKTYEGGYGGHTYYLNRWVQPELLFKYNIFVNKDKVNEYLSKFKIKVENLKSVIKTLEYLRDMIDDDFSIKGARGYTVPRMCRECFSNPDMSIVTKKRKIKPLKPEWLSVKIIDDGRV